MKGIDGIRRALVTGGAGFIGSHLVDRLVDHDVEVLVVDDLSTGRFDFLAEARARGSVALHRIDVRSEGLGMVVERFHPDTIFHLAAQASVPASMSDPRNDADINVMGTINLLETARAVGARRFVFVSSGGALHGAGSKLPSKETHAFRPESPYGVSKMVALAYLDFYRSRHGIDYVALAPSNVYGPRQNSSAEGGVVAIFARAMLVGRPTVIYGDGEQTRDFVFVEDVVEALIAGARKLGGKFLHVSTGMETSINALHEIMAEIVPTDRSPRHEAEKPGDIRRSWLDSSAARKHLGWEAWTPLDEGLAATVAWLRANPEP